MWHRRRKCRIAEIRGSPPVSRPLRPRVGSWALTLEVKGLFPAILSVVPLSPSSKEDEKSCFSVLSAFSFCNSDGHPRGVSPPVNFGSMPVHKHRVWAPGTAAFMGNWQVSDMLVGPSRSFWFTQQTGFAIGCSGNSTLWESRCDSRRHSVQDCVPGSCNHSGLLCPHLYNGTGLADP